MKTLLVTGASRGIGLEICKLAAKEGNNVIALSRNIKPFSSIENIYPFSVDLSDEIPIKSFVEKIGLSFSKIDVLINNAGNLINKPFLKTSSEDFKKIFQVNLFAVASLIRLIFPLIDSKGHVVNICSMGGVQGTVKFPGLSAYSSSKGGLITLTELLAEEFKDMGPAFNALALGSVQTEMLEEAFPGYKASVSSTKMASYILDFAFNGHQFYNGKVLPIALSTP